MLAVDVALLPATGTAEREAAIELLAELPDSGRITLGADKHYDTRDFVEQLREMEVTPHVAQNDTHRRSAIDLVLLIETLRHDNATPAQRLQLGDFRRRRIVLH